MRIMIDMDEVLITDTLLGIMSDFTGQDFNLDDARGYYLQDLLEDKKDDFFEYFKGVNMYEKAKLLDDVFEVVKMLNDKYEVYICTAYVWPEMVKESGNVLKHKYDFLYETLPFIHPNQYIFASNKEIIDCDVKIDDKLQNLKGAKLKLLYTAYHNKDVSDEELKKENIIRVDNWLDIKRILLDEAL